MACWIVTDFDGAALGEYPTRREAVMAHSSSPVLRRYSYPNGEYEYVCGFPGEEDTEQFFVQRRRDS